MKELAEAKISNFVLLTNTWREIECNRYSEEVLVTIRIA